MVNDEGSAGLKWEGAYTLNAMVLVQGAMPLGFYDSINNDLQRRVRCQSMEGDKIRMTWKL